MKAVVVTVLIMLLCVIVWELYITWKKADITELDCQHVCFIGSSTKYYEKMGYKLCKCCLIDDIKNMGNFTTCDIWRNEGLMKWVRTG